MRKTTLLLAWLTLGGCMGGPIPPIAAPGGSVPDDPDDLSDSEILHVLHTANQTERALAELALRKDANPAVQRVARRLQADRLALDAQAERVHAEALVVPNEESVYSLEMARNADATLTRLEALDGDAFDRAWLDAVAAHALDAASLSEGLLADRASQEAVEDLVARSVTVYGGHVTLATDTRAALRPIG